MQLLEQIPPAIKEFQRTVLSAMHQSRQDLTKSTNHSAIRVVGRANHSAKETMVGQFTIWPCQLHFASAKRPWAWVRAPQALPSAHAHCPVGPTISLESTNASL